MITTFQEPTELSLIVAGSALPGPVTIAAQAGVAWRDLELTFNVLCESHEVVIRRQGDVVLHERLSCMKTARVVPIAHVHDFADGLDHAYRQPGYAVQVETKDGGDGAVRLPEPNLFVSFPDPVGGDTAPFTSIAWEVRDGAFHWQTVHFYVLPGRTLGVVSRSTVDDRLSGAAGWRADSSSVVGREVVRR